MSRWTEAAIKILGLKHEEVTEDHERFVRELMTNTVPTRVQPEKLPEGACHGCWVHTQHYVITHVVIGDLCMLSVRLCHACAERVAAAKKEDRLELLPEALRRAFLAEKRPEVAPPPNGSVPGQPRRRPRRHHD